MQKLLKDLPPDQKKLVDDLIPAAVSATTVQRVLQALLRERVSIRDLATILEGIAEVATTNASVAQITEHVRGRLARQLCFANKGDDGALAIVTMSPDWEAAFADALIGPGDDKQLALAPSRLQDFIRLAVRENFLSCCRQRRADLPVLLDVGPVIRPYVRSIVERFRPQTVVMSQNEIHPKARLKTVGVVVTPPLILAKATRTLGVAECGEGGNQQSRNYQVTAARPGARRPGRRAPGGANRRRRRRCRSTAGDRPSTASTAAVEHGRVPLSRARRRIGAATAAGGRR